MLRGIVPAIILTGLFAGLGSGQGIGGSGTSIVCNAGTVLPTQIRGEGQTELVNDIVLTCSGGTPLTAGAGSAAATASSPNAIPQISVTIGFPGYPTSRILAGAVTEALLLVDEPGAVGLNTYGSSLPISVCPAPTATAWQSAASPGCQEWVGNIGANANVPVLSTNGQTNTTPGYNAFPGVLSPVGITFNGVPMLATAANSTHVFRITNLRVNAVVNPGNISTIVSVTGLQASVTNPTPVVAVANPSLSASLQNSIDGAVLTPPVFASSSGVGSAGAPSLVGYLRFGGSGYRNFQTRVSPLAAGSGGSGQSATAEQNVPGAIYNSESGFTPYVGTTPQYFGGNTNYIPGLADSGTRVKAVFNNIPSGATIYVGTRSGGNTTSGLAVSMVSGPTAPESAALVAPTVAIGGAGFLTLVPSNGSATATWEVTTASPYSPTGDPENIDIPVAVYAAPGVASAGAVTVSMSYAPTYPIQGMGPQFIPSFFDTSTPMPLFTINGTPTTPVPSSLILVLCGLGALLLFAAGRKLAAR